MARPSHTTTSPGGARLAVRGRMVLDGVQSLEANQKLALALMERAGLGFSTRGFGACRFLVAPRIKEQ
jgi:hypothetical protein